MRAFRGFHPRLLMENHFVVVLSPIQIAENSSLNIFRKPDARQYMNHEDSLSVRAALLQEGGLLF